MKFDSPDACRQHLMECAARGDMDSVLKVFEKDATFVHEDGTAVHGIKAIREALSEFVNVQPRLSIRVSHEFQAGGDLVILYNDWTFETTGPNGLVIPNAGSSVQVLRRQQDGGWLIAFDDHGRDNH